MKQLVLTGIAQETSLNNPEETLIMLVFNDGEVRVPTNEYGVNAILESLNEGGEPPQQAVQQHPEGAELFGGNGEAHDDDGVTDDGEYDDVNDGVGSI